MIPTGYEAALLDSWAYFVHLAMILTPLFIGASFLVGLAQEYLPPERVTAAGEGALSFFWDTLPYIAVGIAIGALIHGAVPAPFLQRIAGPGNPLATPLAALAGAPLYVSISGMLPIAHSLAEQGIPIGTVMAFVIGGAGISIPNLILLNKLFERRLLAIYATSVVTIGIVIGVLFNTVLPSVL